MDVGPLVIPHPQAAKLTEPGKGSLHDPPPPTQTTPMLCAAHVLRIGRRVLLREDALGDWLGQKSAPSLERNRR